MRISYQWNNTSVTSPMGFRLVVNPKCGMYLTGNGPECGKPATVRVTRKRCWSFLWCPEHAAEFDL